MPNPSVAFGDSSPEGEQRRGGLTSRLSTCPIQRVDTIDRPSPNHDERQLPVTMIVLHYTGMPDAEGALCRLTSPEAKVSAHYCVDED